MMNFNWNWTRRPGYADWHMSYRQRGNCPLLALALAMNPKFAATAKEPNLQINCYNRHAPTFNRHRDSNDTQNSLVYIFGTVASWLLKRLTALNP